MTAALLFLAMLAGHALCDGPLQGARMSAAKRPGSDPVWPWQLALATHAGLHGLTVAAITGALWLGALEFVAHAGIDALKCRGKIGAVDDQILHVVCKAIWAGLAVGIV